MCANFFNWLRDQAAIAFRDGTGDDRSCAGQFAGRKHHYSVYQYQSWPYGSHVYLPSLMNAMTTPNNVQESVPAWKLFPAVHLALAAWGLLLISPPDSW